MKRLMKYAAALVVTMVQPAEAWLAGPGACHSKRVHTIQHHQKLSCFYDCIVSLSRMTPTSLTVTVYDFHLRTHDLWNWQTFAGRNWEERPLSLRVGVMANEDRHFSAIPISSQPLGSLKGKHDTVDKAGIRLAGLRPDHHYTLIIYSPELAGVGGRGGHTAPFERRCFRSAQVPNPPPSP